MKKRDFQALKDQSSAEMMTKLAEMQIELAKKRHEKRVGRLSNVRSIARLADDIARIKTVLREQELAGAESSAV
jgi:large subunit ribosomal protein L29